MFIGHIHFWQKRTSYLPKLFYLKVFDFHNVNTIIQMFKANPEKQDTTILKTKSVTERITEGIIIHPVGMQ